MTKSTLRKLPGGCYGVTLCVPPEYAVFAKAEARARGFVDADDYLSCMLNTAMFHEMEREPCPLPASFDGCDDDIPF